MKKIIVNILNFSKSTLHKISDELLDIIAIVVTFFSPTGYVLAAVGFSILVDTYFGRWKAKSLNQKVTSKITRVSIVNKSMGYMLVILGAFLMDKAFMNELITTFFNIDFAVTKSVGLVFCWIEYSSVDESYKEVTGVSLTEAFKKILKTVKFVKDDINTK